MRTLPSTTMTVILALCLAGADASAQGFPGGGGHAGGRGIGGAHGTHPPPGTPPSAARPAANPLVVFLQGLGALRTELLVRAEQVDAWSAMRDALNRHHAILRGGADEQARDRAQHRHRQEEQRELERPEENRRHDSKISISGRS